MVSDEIPMEDVQLAVASDEVVQTFLPQDTPASGEATIQRRRKRNVLYVTNQAVLKEATGLCVSIMLQ